MKEDQRIILENALRRIRRNQWLVLVGFFLILPVIALASMVLSENGVTVVVVIACIVWFAFAGVTQAVKCPSCGKGFHSRRMGEDSPFVMFNYGSRKCMNCGISLRDLPPFGGKKP